MATEMVVDQINSKLAQLDKDVGTINSRVNRHRAEIDENRSQSKVTEKLVSDLVRRLEVLEERDVLREGQSQSLLEEVERLRGGSGSKGKGVDRGESPFLLREGMLTTDLDDLFAMCQGHSTPYSLPGLSALLHSPYRPLLGH